jgi:tRNA(Ile)-lysidine synthase
VSHVDSGPLTARQFAALMAPFAPFERPPVVAVAVSGGRDSLCLGILARDWSAERGGAAVALIVDHGLRPASAEEAAVTGAVLGGMGIESEILRWTGPKPHHGVQQAARAARYGLLFETCRRRDILHLLVAHHADDQAETVAMRMARGSGADGLAGMAGLIEHRDLRLLRPLLAVPRDRLTATLVSRGVKWVDDPSNADQRFERARLRNAGQLPRADTTDAARRRSALERQLARAATGALEFDADGSIALDQAAFAQLDGDIAGRLLSRAVQALGRRDHPPRRDRLERAVARLSQAGERGKSGKSQDFTLSECRLMLRRAVDSPRLRWIVRPESGRKSSKSGSQTLMPAAFFACDATVRTHLD